MSDRLEDKLRTARGPVMPAEVEARIRHRIQRELFAPAPPSRRFLQKASLAQLLILAALSVIAGWVVIHEVVPVVQSAWERYCQPSGR